MREKVGYWYSINVCTKCEKRLSNNERFYSGGTCKYCGFSSGSTIASCNKVTLRKITVYTGPWWNFWSKSVTFEGVDDYSKQWLDKR